MPPIAPRQEVGAINQGIDREHQIHIRRHPHLGTVITDTDDNAVVGIGKAAEVVSYERKLVQGAVRQPLRARISA
jgi:hypothetical protein